MKKLLSLLIFPFLSFSQADSLSILYIGNSYINSNNLPELVSSIANSMGDYINYNSSLVGGSTLQNHTTNNSTLNLIVNGNWDYVVLQEQSQYPSFPLWQVEQNVFPYATELCQIILENNECSDVVFFMTWGRENGDQSNCENWPPICTYQGMDDLLRERYLIMTDENDAQVSPVGAVWRHIRDAEYDLDLYSSDGSHPSFLGSYIAAVCFYTTFFQKDPLGIPWNSEFNISENNVELINEIVKYVVYDDLDQWSIHSNDLDNDGICNNLDNCPEDYNPNQSDFNNDDIGDSCDEIQLIEKTNNKKIVRFFDVLGRNNTNKNLQLHLYNDGSVEKKYLIE